MSRIQIPRLRDALICFAWIAGLVLIGCLCWILTGSVRSGLLMDSVNRAWAQTGNSRRLEAALSPGALEPGLTRLGSWFSLGEGKRALVFTLMTDGIFVPCAAIVNQEGRVEELLSLSADGNTLLDRVSPGLKQLYIRRIEGEP